MRDDSRIYSSLLLSVLLVVGLSFQARAQDADHLVSAKLGIQIHSNEGVRWARSTERIRAGDKIRIFVIPKEASFVYIVHSDQKTVSTLLNEEYVDKRTPRVLPSNNEFYQVDGTGEIESITIICSSDRLVDAWTLLKSGPIPHTKWTNIEKRLVEKSKIVLSRNSSAQARILIGGSVRSLPRQINTEGDDIAYQITLAPAVTTSCPAPLTFSATNLPPGLRIDATTGLISGTLPSGAASGSPYAVMVSGRSGQAKACFHDTLTWTVLDNPSLTPELQELRTFSGKSLLVKTYDFTVKK